VSSAAALSVACYPVAGDGALPLGSPERHQGLSRLAWSPAAELLLGRGRSLTFQRVRILVCRARKPSAPRRATGDWIRRLF